MGSHVVEDEFSSIPKIFNKVYCNFNPSCVPRKLRSAIRKRNCMSSSAPLLDSKRLKHSINSDVESVRKVSLTTTENECSGSLSRLAVSMAISKEEEEVAETLFALAGMIPLKGESSEAIAPDLGKNKHDYPMLSFKGPVILKKEPESASHASSRAVMNTAPAAQGSRRDSMPEIKQLNINPEISVPPVHLESNPPLLRTYKEKHLTNSASLFQLSAESSWHSRLKETKQYRVLHAIEQSHISSGAVDVVANQDSEHITSERRDNGLTSKLLHGSKVDGRPTQSSAVIFPLWSNTVPSSRPVLHGDVALLDKVSISANGGRKSRKRCVTHIYLSRLIQAQQTSEGKHNLRLDASQLQSFQYSSLAPDLNRINGSLVTSHMFGSAACGNVCETGNKVSIKVEHHEDKAEGSLSSRRCESKQGVDFLSLSTGAGPDANNNTEKLSNYMESKDNLLHIHSSDSTTQGSASLPCSTAHNRFSSGVYKDQVAVASMAFHPVSSKVHIPSYLPNDFALTLGTAKTTEQSQPRSHQQQVWTAQLAAQFRSGKLNSSKMTNWQNRRQDPYSSTHHMQSHLPPPQPSLGLMGAKYLHLSLQQKQLIGACSPSPFLNSKPQIGQCPSVYEDKGGQFRADGVLPLPLLCNEKLS